jgi:hypothetical protein
MRRLLVILALLAPIPFPAVAQDGRDAIIRSLQSLGISQPLRREQITLAFDTGGSQPLLVHGFHFDQGLRAWLVELRCMPPERCVPSLATVHVDDAHLISPKPQSLRSARRIRAGERLSLVTQLGPIRITEPVVCIQSGLAGQRIRVRVTATKIVKRALVTESGELRAIAQ